MNAPMSMDILGLTTPKNVFREGCDQRRICRAERVDALRRELSKLYDYDSRVRSNRHGLLKGVRRYAGL